ncbi:MAG: hypothetical protein G01um101413_371 [Parcubacteria group bacterium Gr01-1014_13]|nr:MAG: hypothetical protein G01um101413_371 [Parcubacteria group bacterium Gr01-1014_13]
MSLLVQYEEDLESKREEVYCQLKKLVKNLPMYLSATTKRALRIHFDNFDFGYQWTEDGEELIQKARMEQMATAERWKRYEEFELFEDEPWIDDQTKKLWGFAEYWENKFDQETINACRLKKDLAFEYGSILVLEKASGKTYHRNGIKRDKTEFWNRPQPTRRRQIKLHKKMQRRQNDNQPQE